MTGHTPLPIKYTRVRYQIKQQDSTPATLIDAAQSAAIHRVLFTMAQGFSAALIDYFTEALLHEQKTHCQHRLTTP